MPNLPPPPVTPSYQIIHKNEASQTLMRSPQNGVNAVLFAALPEAALPEVVDLQLRSLMQSLPTLEFTPDSITAQAGPVKPGSMPLPKPTDPPLPEPPPVKGLPAEVTADRQEYNVKTQVFTAIGNVIVRYQKSELKADRVEVNLKTQVAVADGNVFFTRGEQRVRGSRLEYSYVTAKGSLANAAGAINLDTLKQPEASQKPEDLASGSLTFVLGGETRTQRKGVRRIGFTADKLLLDGNTWQAENLRVTNDPFSPPELEIVTSRAKLTPISPTQDRLTAESPTLVFDRVFSLPIPINQLTMDRFDRGFPALLGFDRLDRGGLFYQQNYDVISHPDLNLRISPQLLLQQGLGGGNSINTNSGNFLNTSLLGVSSRLDAVLPDGQYLSGAASLSGLDLSKFGNLFRAQINYSRPILGDHSLVAQYAYRERVYNGSLGFQNVNNTIGATLFSPNRFLGDTGINFKYQVGAQYISADRGDIEAGTVGSLGRLQSAIALARSFSLWRGEALPAEKNTGLKYSPEPIVPGLDAFVGLTGAYSFYTSGATQGFLSGTVGLAAVLGNFSRPFLDYTRINLSYTQGGVSGESPFLFDRIADKQIVTAGILQQIYGPVRLGVQQTWNPSTGKVIDSNFTLEISRRTYAIVLRYNPTQQIGELVLRVSDFNWNDPPSGVTTVTGGVEQN